MKTPWALKRNVISVANVFLYFFTNTTSCVLFFKVFKPAHNSTYLLEDLSASFARIQGVVKLPKICAFFADVKKTLNLTKRKILYLWFEVNWPHLTPKILNGGKVSSHVTTDLLLHVVRRFWLWLVLSGNKSQVTPEIDRTNHARYTVFSVSKCARLQMRASDWPSRNPLFYAY